MLKLFVCVVLVVVAAELGTRLIASRLPPPLQWQDYEAQKKVGQIDALGQHGGSKVVLLGSSLVDLGVDPNVIDSELGIPDSTKSSYDAALDSSIPRLDAVWAEHVVVPNLHPKVFVIGLGAYDLGGNDNPARPVFYTGFLNSSGARKLLNKNDLIQNLNQWLGQYSALWFHKVQLRDPETVVRAILDQRQPSSMATMEAQEVLPDGHQTVHQYAPFDNADDLPISDWFYGKKDPAALKQLIGYAHQRHITVVLVNMPVTNQLVDEMPQKEASFDQYTADLKRIGKETHTPVLEFDSIRNIKYFSDQIHLNHTGAELFSHELGAALKPLLSADLSGH